MTTIDAPAGVRKEIVWERESRDYAMYLNGELVGFARTYHEGEVTLDQLVYEQLARHADERHVCGDCGAALTDNGALYRRCPTCDALMDRYGDYFECGNSRCRRKIAAKQSEPGPNTPDPDDVLDPRDEMAASGRKGATDDHYHRPIHRRALPIRSQPRRLPGGA